MTYKGKVNVTVDGRPCKNWKMYHSKYANYSEDNNYCRNPKPDTFNKTWCYTGDNYAFGICKIPACGKYNIYHYHWYCKTQNRKYQSWNTLTLGVKV